MTIMDTKADQAMAKSLEDLDKEIAEAVAATNTPPAPPPTDLERFEGMVERNREHLRQRMLARESHFELARVRLIDDFRVRLRNLENEAAEELRALEQRHEVEAAKDRKFFAKLEATRGEL